jgi:hypothetical protein
MNEALQLDAWLAVWEFQVKPEFVTALAIWVPNFSGIQTAPGDI